MSAQERDYTAGSVLIALARRTGRAAARLANRGKERFMQVRVVREWRESWRRRPLQCLGILLICAVLANTALLFLLGRPVGRAGIGLRFLLLLAGAASLRSAADWESVREGSFFLRFLFPRRKE